MLLDLHMRRQHIGCFGHNRLAPLFSTVDSSLTLVISHEFIASTGTGEEGDGHGWLCAICEEMFPIGEYAKQFPCNRNHTFHPKCIMKWLDENLSCPLCRYDMSLSNHALLWSVSSRVTIFYHLRGRDINFIENSSDF